MTDKPTYEELEKKVLVLEQEVADLRCPDHGKDRQQVEAAFRKSEQKYRTILDTMEEGYYEADLRGTFTFWNKAECRIHGRTPEEMIGLNNRNFTSPETAKKVYRVFNQVYKTGVTAKVIDYETTRKDGKRIMLETSASLLRNAAGEPIGFYGISRDVTEKKKAELALRESEEKHRTILDSMEEGYYEINMEGNFTFLNKATCKTHGRSPDELMAMNYREFTAPETLKRFAPIINQIYTTGIPIQFVDYEVIRSDGTVVTLEVSISTIRDAQGKTIGFRGVTRDVTDKKKAEKNLKESEEKYRLLVENADEGIFISQDGRTKFPNAKACALTGYNIYELADMAFVDLVHLKDKKMVEERQQEILEGRKKPDTSSFRMRNKDNEILWVELNTIALDWEGRPATLNFLRDITPQKKIKAQLLQAQKMEAIGTLAGGIAHDFNNLLMGIQGNASLVLLDIESGHPHYAQLRGIEELVKNGAELTKQLLGAAKGGKYEVKPTNINTLIEKSSSLFGRTRKEISIHKKLSKEIGYVEVDRSQIEQVLLNLYVNAWHAMPDGGELYLETQNVTLDEYYTKTYRVKPGKFVRISVTDTGIGMDEPTRQKVFDPFFTTKKMGRGTGLGLASAYGIIGNHNGIINVYSEMGEGTTFNIYLPISKKKAEKETQLSEQIHFGAETILFVDDEDTIIEIGRRLLKRLGYNVITAKSGDEAIDIYRDKYAQIDLVILDMIMPGKGGGETYDQIKIINPSAKVLLSSGYSINGQAQKILDRGCKGFLQKPFNVADLSKRLRLVLEEK